MAVYLTCPHCQATLQIPEDCGGQSTKCAECAREFVIPGPRRTTSAVPVCAVVAPSGDKLSAQWSQAQREVQRLAANAVESQARLLDCQRHRDRVARRVWACETLVSARQFVQYTSGRVGGLFIAMTAGAAVMVVLASLLSLSAVACFAAGVIGFVISTSGYLLLASVPDDRTLAESLVQFRAELQRTRAMCDQLDLRSRQQTELLAAAELLFQRLQTEREGRLHWLRSCHWREMSAANFPRFVQQVLAEHGYQVEPIPAPADQGVDLIAARNGRRIAVQAKGCPGNSAGTGPVGNDAVQQVHAGRGYYRCEAAAVITNATFTSGATELAARIECRLIDSQQLGDWIGGQIEL